MHEKDFTQQDFQNPTSTSEYIKSFQSFIKEIALEDDIKIPSSVLEAYSLLIPHCVENRFFELEETNIPKETLACFTQKHIEMYDQEAPELKQLLAGITVPLENKLLIHDSQRKEILTQLIKRRFPYISQKDGITEQLLNMIPSKDLEEIQLQINQIDIRSCMYGGKSTLAFKILDLLEAHGAKTQYFISDVMGEDYITARSLPEGQGRVRKATRYGELFPLNSKTLENIDIVILDEFSFLNEATIKNFIKECRSRNIKIVLTGLNKDSKGVPTVPYKEGSTIRNGGLHYQCKAFVSHNDERLLKTELENGPQGERTIRYVNINGHWILDLGFLPYVTSKVYEKIVFYKPALRGQTLNEMLRERPQLMESLNSQAVQTFQKQFFDALSSYYGYN